MNMFQHLTVVFYSTLYQNNSLVAQIKPWDFRFKNILIYMCSDITASVLKAPFEVRKQLIQMYSKDITFSHLSQLTAMTWFPLALRDVSFRTLILCFYYATTTIEHKPELKYSIPQITDFMKQRRAQSEMYGTKAETVHELSHLFYEFHNYEIKTKITTRLSFLILANAVSTLLTNPIDVCLTKIAT